MVASRDEAKRDFARRLNEALDEKPECPKASGRGRIAWVAKRYEVSNEAAAKWLDGRSMPDQTNMARISTDLRVNPFWLWSGQKPRRPTEELEIIALWSETDDLGQSNILQTARAWHNARPKGKPEAP